MLRDWLGLARPSTLAPVLLIATVFGLLPVDGHVNVHQFLLVVLGGGILVVANFGSNVVDQIAGQLEDGAHPIKKNRPIVTGRIPTQSALSVAVVGWLLAVAVGAIFLPSSFVVIVLVVMAFAFTYTHPPAAKRRPFPIGLLWIATPRGALGIAATWSILGSVTDPKLWIGVLALTVPFTFFGNSSKDVDDYSSDLVGGNVTPATLWGPTACRWFAFVGFIWLPVAVLVLGLWHSDPFLLAVPGITALGLVGATRWSGEKYWRVGFYGGYMALAMLLGLGMVWSGAV